MATTESSNARHAHAPFTVTVRGNSMKAATGGKSFQDGTVLLVDPAKQPRSGSYVLVDLGEGGTGTLAQYLEDDGRVYLKWLNPLFQTRDITDRRCKFRGTVTQQFVD